MGSLNNLIFILLAVRLSLTRSIRWVARRWRHTYVSALRCVCRLRSAGACVRHRLRLCALTGVRCFVCVRLNAYRFFAYVTLFLYILSFCYKAFIYFHTAAAGCQWRETATSAFVHTRAVQRSPAVLCFKYERRREIDCRICLCCWDSNWGQYFLNSQLIFSFKALWYACFRDT